MENLLTHAIGNDIKPFNALGFTGAYQDPVTAFYPLGNGYRWYMPGPMRFNAPDSLSPFGAGGPNPYAYCAGDPVNGSDPTGHMFNPVEDAEDIVRTTTQAATRTNDSLAVSAASTASSTATPSGSREIVASGFSVPSAASASSSAKKYVPVLETMHPRFKNMGLIMVEQEKIALGAATLTLHFSDVPPDEVRRAGGIMAPNPDFPDETLLFTNRGYDGGPNSPYVKTYLPIDPGQSSYGVGAYHRYEYYTISRPEDYAIWKLGVAGSWGENRIVLRHRMIPVQDVVAVWDKHGPPRLEQIGGFENTYNVSLPRSLQQAIAGPR